MVDEKIREHDKAHPLKEFKEFYITNGAKEGSGDFEEAMFRPLDGMCERTGLGIWWCKEFGKDDKRKYHQVDLDLDATELELFIEYLQEQLKVVKKQEECDGECEACVLNEEHYAQRKGDK